LADSTEIRNAKFDSTRQFTHNYVVIIIIVITQQKIMMVITIIVIISIERHWVTNAFFMKRNLLNVYACWVFVELSTQTLNVKSMLTFQILSYSPKIRIWTFGILRAQG